MVEYQSFGRSGEDRCGPVEVHGGRHGAGHGAALRRAPGPRPCAARPRPTSRGPRGRRAGRRARRWGRPWRATIGCHGPHPCRSGVEPHLGHRAAPGCRADRGRHGQRARGARRQAQGGHEWRAEHRLEEIPVTGHAPVVAERPDPDAGQAAGDGVGVLRPERRRRVVEDLAPGGGGPVVPGVPADGFARLVAERHPQRGRLADVATRDIGRARRSSGARPGWRTPSATRRRSTGGRGSPGPAGRLPEA